MGSRRRGRSKKGLEEVFRYQLEFIEQEEPLPTGVTLHPYIRVWLGCKRFSGGMTGAPLLPGPGSYLEQDAELMLAFELLEGIWRELEQVREELKKARQKNEEALANGQGPLIIAKR